MPSSNKNKRQSKTTTSKAKKSSRLSFSSLSKHKLWLFIISFGLVGAFFGYRSFASPELPVNPDDVVAGYVNETASTVSQDASGNILYEMSSASTYVLKDGTLICDGGAKTGPNVKTTTLNPGEVKKLQRDMVDTGVTGLPDEISTSSNQAVVQFEGIAVAGGSTAKGTAVYPGAAKPAQFVKAQAKLQSLCLKATKAEMRSQVKAPRQPKLKNSKSSILSRADQIITPKVSACCTTASRDVNFENTEANKINYYRVGNGRAAIARNGCMDLIAQAWTAHLASTRTLAENPNYATFIRSNCFPWRAAAENVGRGPDEPSIWAAFIASPPHNANILDRRWNYMGIGAARDSYGTYWVTQVFAQY